MDKSQSQRKKYKVVMKETGKEPVNTEMDIDELEDWINSSKKTKKANDKGMVVVESKFEDYVVLDSKDDNIADQKQPGNIIHMAIKSEQVIWTDVDVIFDADSEVGKVYKKSNSVKLKEELMKDVDDRLLKTYGKNPITHFKKSFCNNSQVWVQSRSDGKCNVYFYKIDRRGEDNWSWEFIDVIDWKDFPSHFPPSGWKSHIK